MTKKEALVSELQISVPANSLEKALIDANISPLEDYTPADKELIDKTVLGLLRGVLASASSLTEGGFSITKDTEGIKARIAYYEGLYSIPAVSGIVTVRGRSNIW